jgi:peptidoglycan/xylan/chitin deacetylase (PgdA/CDA1 family)
MDQSLYDYSPIVERPALRWPDDARVAFYLAVNVEHFHIDRQAVSLAPETGHLVPDPLNFGWRDYGARVGIWRLMSSLDDLSIPATAMLNADVCAAYPQILDAGKERDWCWVAHGFSNSIFHSDMDEGEERARLQEMKQILTAAGVEPKGWLGPALSETFATPKLLAELGFTYVLDWCNDDQPFELNVEGMISVPYSIELNDITLCVGKNLSGPEFARLVRDHLDQLLKDSESTGRVMALAIHPFISNQPFRHRYLVEALEYVKSQPGVWITTSDQIAGHYLAAGRDPADSAPDTQS